jgi:putative endonuclease
MNELGQRGEDLVSHYYQDLGWKIVARNYIFPKGKQTGEIDLIVEKGKEIIFVEVKTRSNSKFGDAAESVNFSKQQRLVRTTKLFLQLHPKYQDFDYRIDVATVDLDNLAQPVIIIPDAIEDSD